MSGEAESATASHGVQGSESTSSQLPQGGATSSSTPLIPPPDQLSGALTLQERENVSATNAIHRGLWTKPSGETVPVMIKVVQKAWLQSERPLSLTGEERFERRIARETSIWHATRHENILPFIGYQLIDGAPLLVSPVYAQGDLQSYISKNPKVTYIERLELLLDAARGLAYLHNLQPPIAHGSIHPSDILVTQDIRGVICDFGNSRVVTTFETGFTTDLYSYSRMGYSSPELIKGITLPTPMSDVYGLGGTILRVMTGKDPFHQKRTSAQVVLAIANGVIPSPRDHRELPESDPLWSLMNHCWNAEPSQRHTAAQIVYKVNLILHCGDGLTAPLPMPVIASTAPADPEEHDDQSEASAPPLPPPLPGNITITSVKPIGRGGYGEVHRGLWTPPGKDPIPVAVKHINIDDLGPEEGQDQNVLVKRIRRETVIWKAAEHTNIVRFYGHQLSGETPTLISSWCENGDLWSYVQKNRQLGRRERLKLLCGAGRGLAHLHSLQPPICHGDIKPQNVLIGDNMEALLCDFGISRIITESTTDMTTLGRATGTAGFAPKEVIEGSGPTEKGDVYAFGGLILATMTGKRPFWTKRNQYLIIISVSRDETPNPSDYPELPIDPLWTLMRRCWDPEPTQRPTMSQIVAELQKELDRPSTLG